MTNVSLASSEKEIGANNILLNEELIDEYIYLPRSILSIKDLMKLFNIIYRFYRPFKFYYLMPQRSYIQLFRDYILLKLLFFPNKIIGHTFKINLQSPIIQEGKYFWEHESNRLRRLISFDMKYDLKHVNNSPYTLNFSSVEIEEFNRIKSKYNLQSYISISFGSKTFIKDWEDHNWIIYIKSINLHYPNFKFVFIGSADEYERVESLFTGISIEFVNLCGITTIRMSALVIKNSIYFVGHDSGPMHLASLVNSKIVAIFSSQNKPGEWFPLSNAASVHYNRTECFGCYKKHECIDHKKKCILEITPEEVVSSTLNLLTNA